jgi:phosphotransferase system enzyme I (PtsI)
MLTIWLTAGKSKKAANKGSLFFNMVLRGIGAAPGFAAGKIHIHKKTCIEPIERIDPGGEERQLEKYQLIKKQAKEKLEKIMLSMEKHDPEKAKIFAVHQDIADDIIINEEITDKIKNEHWAGDWAIYQVYETCLSMVRKAPDPLIAQRAADFEDVRSLLLRLWQGIEDEGLSLTEPVIIAACDLLPSDTAALDKNKVLALLTETGGVTSHSAIIAKSYGIPAILGIQGLLNAVKQEQFAAVDSNAGTVILDPDKATIEDYNKKTAVFILERMEADTFLSGEAYTACKERIEVGLNIANASDDELAASPYVDSVGLFRTEFLYMGAKALPAEDEQFAVYRKVLEHFGQRPVTLRTLDIGGDKPLSYLNLSHEDNPFLGNRALRFCFSHPEIFKTQIRACLRASVYGNLQIMLPMVSSLDDIHMAKEFIRTVINDMKKESLKVGEIKTGIMIEIPSIAFLADHAAREVDFASIGSNDLCQYLCAADRMNSAVAPYYQSYHPAMFRLIKETAAAFNNAGKPLSICGELGADPLAIPVLIGLGMRKFSMAAASVAAVKRAIASSTVKNAEKMAAKVLELTTAAEVKNYLSKNI